MCTLEKRGNLFFLVLTGENEHRLGPALLASIRSALVEVRSQYTRGSVLITTAKGKFFSNGFDLAWARSPGSDSIAKDRTNQMIGQLTRVVAELISLPMPTIAAVTGHAAAAGLVLAMSHDYIVMRRDRGFLYMSELDIGLTVPKTVAIMFGYKVSSNSGRRAMLLGGAKTGADEAVKMGIVDSAHDSAEQTVEAAVRKGEQLGERKWDGLVYAEIRRSMYPDLCGLLGLVDTPSLPSRL